MTTKLSPESLDTLEDYLIKQLTDDEGAAPAAKLDIIRKLLEKNNRLYVRPKPKDCGPALDEISDVDTDARMVLPFRTRK